MEIFWIKVMTVASRPVANLTINMVLKFGHWEIWGLVEFQIHQFLILFEILFLESIKSFYSKGLSPLGEDLRPSLVLFIYFNIPYMPIFQV